MEGCVGGREGGREGARVEGWVGYFVRRTQPLGLVIQLRLCIMHMGVDASVEPYSSSLSSCAL